MRKHYEWALNQHSAEEDADGKQTKVVLDKLKWERQDAAACSPPHQLLDRSDLTIDALLACPTQPVRPTIPTFNFYFMKSNAQENQVASGEEARPTAKNSSSPVSSQVNLRKEGGPLSTNDASAFKGGGASNHHGSPSRQRGGVFDFTLQSLWARFNKGSPKEGGS
jgi:hypothetical protein